MAFTPSQPADPAKYFSAGLQIANQMRENAAAQERNKINDTFNQTLTRMRLGMDMENQAFNRLNMMQDNARQQQALGAQLINAAGKPETQWQFVNGRWVKTTTDPNASLRATGMNLVTGGAAPLPTGGAGPTTVPVPAGGNGLWPVIPAPEAGELPNAPTDVAPSEPLLDGPPPEGVTPDVPPPTSPPVSEVPLMLQGVPQPIPNAVPPAPVPQPIPAFVPPGQPPQVITPNNVPPSNTPGQTGIPSIYAPVQPVAAPPERAPVIAGYEVPQGTPENVIADLQTSEKRLNAAQQERDFRYKAWADTVEQTRQNAIGITGTPPAMFNEEAEKREVPFRKELSDAELKLEKERDALDAIIKGNNKERAVEREAARRTARFDSLIQDQLKSSGIRPDHPVVQGERESFKVADPRQQDDMEQKLTRKIRSTQLVEQDLNRVPWIKDDLSIDGNLEVRSDPVATKDALDQLISTRSKLKSIEKDIPKQEPGKGKPYVDDALLGRYQAALGSYDGALEKFRSTVNVVAKPEVKPTLAPGEGVRRLPAAAAGAAPAATPAAVVQTTTPAGRQMTGFITQPAAAAAQPSVGEWWTEQKTQVAKGRGSDARGRVPSLTEFDNDTILAVASGGQIYNTPDGNLTFDPAKAGSPAQGVPRFAGAAADRLALELGFNPDEIPKGGDSRKNTGNRWENVRYRDIIRAAAEDEAKRRGLIQAQAGEVNQTLSPESQQKAKDIVGKYQ